MPSLDVSATGMPAAAADLRRQGTELRLARIVGQVRDLLDRSVPAPPPIPAAVDAMT